MNIIDPIKQRLENLLTSPGNELGSWARFLRFQIHLWRFCARRLYVDNAQAMSAALSFRTIFALVPALVLAVLIAKSLNVLDDSKKTIQRFLDASGIAIIQQDTAPQTDAAPASSDDPQNPQTSPSSPSPSPTVSVADYIQDVVEKLESKLTLGRIGPIGGALLIWTALTLLTTIERSLNRIYGARQSRSLARRIVVYWSVLTLGPILLTLANYLGTCALEFSLKIDILNWLLSALGWTGPIIMGILLLAALYKLMPNTHVSFKSAFGGALIAVPIWLTAKWGFNLYVYEVVGTKSVYGALALLPIFLLWINLSWWIFLFGAEISNTAANLSRMQLAEQAQNVILGPAELITAALTVARHYQNGLGPLTFRKIATQLNLPDESIHRLLDRLIEKNIICPVENSDSGKFVLSRPADKIPLLEVLDLTENHTTLATNTPNPELARSFDRIKKQTDNSLGSFTLANALND